MKLDFDFKAVTAEFTVWDLGIPKFNFPGITDWNLLHFQPLTSLTGTYAEEFWNCISEPQCLPVILKGPVSLNGAASSIDISVAKSSFNDFIFNIAILPNPYIYATFTPAGCCQEGSLEWEVLSDGILSMACTSREGMTIWATYEELTKFFRFIQFHQFTIDYACLQNAGFYPSDPSAKLTWNANITLDVKYYTPFGKPTRRPGAAIGAMKLLLLD